MFLPKVNAWLLGNNNNSNVRKGRVEGGDVVKQQRFRSESESNTFIRSERERESSFLAFSFAAAAAAASFGFSKYFSKNPNTKDKEK